MPEPLRAPIDRPNPRLLLGTIVVMALPSFGALFVMDPKHWFIDLPLIWHLIRHPLLIWAAAAIPPVLAFAFGARTGATREEGMYAAEADLFDVMFCTSAGLGLPWVIYFLAAWDPISLTISLALAAASYVPIVLFCGMGFAIGRRMRATGSGREAQVDDLPAEQAGRGGAG